MAKVNGVASQLSGKVGQLIYRHTKYGTVVYEAPVKAVAASGFHFVKWSDNNTSATRTVTVNGDLSLQAIFAADASQGGGGNDDDNPGGGGGEGTGSGSGTGGGSEEEDPYNYGD